MEDLQKINRLSTKAQAHLNAYTDCLRRIHRLSAKLLQQNIETTQLADPSTRKRARTLVDSDDEEDACTLDPDALSKTNTRVVRIDDEAVGLWLITAPLRTLSDVRDRSLCLVPGMAISLRGRGCSHCTVLQSVAKHYIFKHFRDMAIENNLECEALLKQKLVCDKCHENRTAE
eukprot:gene26791-32923_t